jgi:SAM-dependent MidA family methyltransferase
MTEAAAFLAQIVERDGPIPVHRFLQVALYHPRFVYYRRGRDPFGREGDYYTAEQLQPVFGELIAARTRQFWDELGRPADFTVVELGAGRGEMAGAFGGFRYIPVELGGSWPGRFTGLVFANEFFDALPVDVAERRAGVFRMMLVGFRAGRFVWVPGPPAGGEAAAYLDRYAGHLPDGARVEIHLEALRWIDQIARRLERGFVLAIDYGYTAREVAAFPGGTLMSYRRHTALEDVLADAGERDITAHVCFTALEDRGRAQGLVPLRLENLARTLMDAGGADGFARVLAGPAEEERARRRAQLKSLLFDFGEKFRTLIQAKGGRQ